MNSPTAALAILSISLAMGMCPAAAFGKVVNGMRESVAEKAIETDDAAVEADEPAAADA